MTELSRRSCSPARPPPLPRPRLLRSGHAAAPPAGKQAPSFYRSKLGDFELTVVSDGARPIPLPPHFVRNVSNEEVLKAAEAAYMPKGTCSRRSIRSWSTPASKLVLIDTGYGRRSAPTVGLLPQNLAAAGIDPQDDRHRADLAPARRPHQRHQEPGRLARVSQCRDHGAGGRLGVLDERREHGEGDRTASEGVVRLRPEDLRRPQGQGDALRVGQGGGARHHRGRDRRATRRVTPRS